MSQSSSPSSLKRSTLAALVELAKQEIPAGQPVNFDTVEAAVVQLLRKLGPDIMTATLLEPVEDPTHPGRAKKGGLLSVPVEL
jgi:hypothetical protein